MLAASSQGGDRQARSPPAGHDHLQPCRGPGDQPLDQMPRSPAPARPCGSRPAPAQRRPLQGRSISPSSVSVTISWRRRFQRGLGQEGGRPREEARVDRLARGDEVANEDQAVRVVFVEPVPEGPKSRPAQEIRDQSGLAEAGLGHDVDEPTVRPGLQPVEEPIPRKRLVGQERALDLGAAQREARPHRRVSSARRSPISGFDGHSQLLHPQPPIPDRRRVG